MPKVQRFFLEIKKDKKVNESLIFPTSVKILSEKDKLQLTEDLNKLNFSLKSLKKA